MPIALASSTTRFRRPSKRVAAPEKVNATSRPSSPKTAPSTTPAPALGSLAIPLDPPDAQAPADLVKRQHAEQQARGHRQHEEDVNVGRSQSPRR